MKVIFVCRANVGRSQVAQSFFSKLSRHESDSAGTMVDESIARKNSPSRMVKDATYQLSIRYMRERGIEISENVRNQVTPEIVDRADLVIVMAKKATWPDFLINSDKAREWIFADPGEVDDEDARKIFDEIGRCVEALAQEIG